MLRFSLAGYLLLVSTVVIGRAESRGYEVVARTGKLDDAQSNGPLHVTIKGDKGNCARHAMTVNNRQGVAVSTDVVCVGDVGNVTSLEISLTGTDGWFLNMIHVVDHANDRVLYFPCDCWFDGGNDAVANSEPRRVLQPSASDPYYTLFIRTSNIDSANTNDDVFVNVIGSRGECTEEPITSDPGLDSLTVVRVLCAGDIGRVDQVRLRIDGDDGWHVNTIDVQDYVSGDVIHFTCNCWLDDGYQPAGPSSFVVSRSRSGCSYEVQGATGDEVDAWSESPLLISLHGSRGDCTGVSMRLNGVANSVQKKVVNCGSCIGEVQRMRVEIQDTDGWFFEKFDVIDAATKAITTFPCSCWMDKGDDATEFSREKRDVFPERYEVMAFTGNVVDARTDHGVYLRIFGERGECEEMILRKNNERNSVQITRIGCRDNIGDVVSVDVSIVGTDGWYMEKLLITDLRDDVMYEVECHCWLDDRDETVGSRRMRHLPAVKL